MNQKKYKMIRKRDEQQKLSVTKRHLTTLLILSLNNISKPAFLSIRTPSTSEFREGFDVLYHAHSSGKEMGPMGASKTSFWGKRTARRRRICPTDGTWDSLALHILPSFFCSFLLLFFHLSRRFSRPSPFATIPFGKRRRSEASSFSIVSSVCVCYRCIPQGF